MDEGLLPVFSVSMTIVGFGKFSIIPLISTSAQRLWSNMKPWSRKLTSSVYTGSELRHFHGGTTASERLSPELHIYTSQSRTSRLTENTY
jgi:hypothetical protein